VNAGVHSITWDGCDEKGKPVSPGVYVVRINARGGTVSGVAGRATAAGSDATGPGFTRKIVVLR